jgi:hypothetical protein
MESRRPPAEKFDLTAFSRPVGATFLWGNDRPTLLRVLYAIVHANDPEFHWLGIRERNEVPEVPGPVELGWIPETRLFLTREPTEAEPQDAVANLALWTIVRSDEPETVLARVSDFVRLPPIAQDILSRLGLDDRIHFVAVSNSDRVRRFYPVEPAGVRHVLEAFLNARVIPVFAAQGSPGEGRWAFDFVFEVRAESIARWWEGVLHCEKAPSGSPFRVGESTPLRSIPGIVEAFRDRPAP